MEQHAEKPGASQSADEGLATSAAEFAGFCRFDDEEGDGETRFHPIVYQNGDRQAERLLNQETPLEYSLTQYRRPVHRSRTHRRWKRDQRTAGRAVKPLAAAEKIPDRIWQRITEPNLSIQLIEIKENNNGKSRLSDTERRTSGLISSGCSSMPSIGNKAQIAHQIRSW